MQECVEFLHVGLIIFDLSFNIQLLNKENNMDWFTYIVVFVGCFVITSGCHIHMLNKMDEYIDKHFEYGSKGRKDFESLGTSNFVTLLVLFLLTLVLTAFTLTYMKTM